MSLTDVTVRNATPKEKSYRLFDSGGLYLEVAPTSQKNNGKLWRWKYRVAGKERRLAFGKYPDVTLAKARELRDSARRQLAGGIDPSAVRRAQKLALAGAESFEVIAREWHERYSPTWEKSSAQRILRRLERDAFPWIGRRPIAELRAPELLAVLRRVESRGAKETAHRVKQNVGQVFRYAVGTGRAERDLTADLRGALPPTKPKHFASIVDPKEVGQLLRALDGYQGHFVTRCALRLAPLTFVRPGELRKAEWTEFHFDKSEWHIPAARMKARRTHIVPLSEQAIAILHELEPLTNKPIPSKPGAPRYLFPGARSRERPMSENAVLAALRRMGYSKDEMTGHGFRSMASTILHEQGWNHQAIERQLAHAERNTVSAAYNFSQHLPERKKMMQAWANYLDALRGGAVVIPLFRAN